MNTKPTPPPDELGAAPCSASLDVADCCISLEEARDVIRRREKYANELMAWMNERRNAPDFTTLGMIQERLRPLCSKPNANVEARRDGAPLPEKTSTPLPRTSCSVLFVGGHADGKRVNLPKLHPAIKSAVKKPRTPETSGAFQSYEIGEEIHTLRRWRSNDTDHTLYVLDSMSDAEAMGRLLEHYRQNANVQP